MNSYVGCQKLETDGDASRVVPMWVMYPTATPSRDTAMGPYTLDVALGAPIEAGPFPLAVISHGTRSAGLVFRTLAHYLARHGFIVALPEHPGDNLFQHQLEYSYQNLEDRPRHIRAVIDTLTGHAQFGPAIQAHNVAVIGHSVGGYTALAIAGGEPHTGFMVDFAHRPEHAEQPAWTALVRQNRVPIRAVPVTADPRVRAVVALAPDFSLYMHEDALAKVEVPVLLIVGEKDQWAHETIVATRTALGNDGRLEARVVPNAGHYAFISVFPEAMKARVGEAAIDPPGFDRSAFQRELERDILHFLTVTMRPAEAAISG
ncbi:alpha/beta hydrolase family protein [Xanthomonas albilineans]|uniref:Putative acyltransferase n=1 Tax=Xanthomonas albilineans TaxID=29447 RepID=Q70C40_XANAL|nr:alpha/beta fold hydrolase [Xanthomonas albilineans]CAE52326.1 putative acyltransferase [Xanthomonas albilineans]